MERGRKGAGEGGKERWREEASPLGPTMKTRPRQTTFRYIRYICCVCVCVCVCFNFIGLQLIYNVVLASGVQQCDSVIHIHIFVLFRFFSHVGYHRTLSRVPCAIQ